jgi:hypothetical protein
MKAKAINETKNKPIKKESKAILFYFIFEPLPIYLTFTL